MVDWSCSRKAVRGKPLYLFSWRPRGGSSVKCEVFDEEAGAVIGKEVQVCFPDEAVHDQLWEGIIVGALKDNSYRVFFCCWPRNFRYKASAYSILPIQLSNYYRYNLVLLFCWSIQGTRSYLESGRADKWIKLGGGGGGGQKHFSLSSPFLLCGPWNFTTCSWFAWWGIYAKANLMLFLVIVI